MSFDSLYFRYTKKIISKTLIPFCPILCGNWNMKRLNMDRSQGLFVSSIPHNDKKKENSLILHNSGETTKNERILRRKSRLCEVF